MSERWIATARDIMSYDLPLGQHVTIIGGFEDGAEGKIVGAHRRAKPLDTGIGWPDVPRFYVWLTDGGLRSGFSTADLQPVIGDVEPVGYVLECFSCGAWGTNDVFGFGNNRKCPSCGSSEVHNHTA